MRQIGVIDNEPDFEKDGIPRAFDCNLDTQTYVHVRGDDRNPDTTQVMQPTIPDFLSFGAFLIEPVKLPVDAWNPGTRQTVVDGHLHVAELEIQSAQKALTTAREQPARFGSRYRLGQISVSITTTSDGRMARSTRRTQNPKSNGAKNTASARPANLSSAIARPASVVVET